MRMCLSNLPGRSSAYFFIKLMKVSAFECQDKRQLYFDKTQTTMSLAHYPVQNIRSISGR